MKPKSISPVIYVPILALLLAIAGCRPSQSGDEKKSTNPPATPPTTAPTAPDPGDAAGRARGAANIAGPAKAKAKPPYHQVYVICVGINENPAAEPLAYAVNDATELAALFEKKYGFANVTLLTNSQATKQGIMDALAAVRTKLSPDGKDDFLFLYSGHGQTGGEVVAEDGVTNSTRYGFLVTYDTNKEKPQTLDEFRQRQLEMGVLAAKISDLPARHRLMFIDSCFSGLAFVQRELSKSQANDIYEDVIATPTVQVMTAGLDTEEAREDSQSQHGVFTDALLQQLRGEDVRTMEEVFFPLRVAVRESLKRLGKPMSMTPQHRYLVYTNGTFVFVPLSQRDNWAAVRPDDPALTEATKKGYFTPVTLAEVTNLTAAAKSTKSPEEWESEVDRYEARAAMGDPYATVALSQIYGQGIGVPANPQRAKMYNNESTDFLTASRTLNIASLAGIRNPFAAAIVNSLVKVDMNGATKAGFSLRGKDLARNPELLKAGFDGVKNLLGGNSGSGGGAGDNSAGAPTSNASSTNKENFWKRNAPSLLGGSGSGAPKVALKVPSHGTNVEIEVELKGGILGLNKSAKAGISAMQIGDYTNAVHELTAAVNDKPKNESYQYALAVAMELIGDYQGARAHYAEANKLTGGVGSAAALNAIKRLDAQPKP